MNIDLFRPMSIADAQIINAPVIESLRTSLSQSFAQLVAGYDRYAIFDFPNHDNIGDSAIYCGQLALCRDQFGKDPVYVEEIPRDINKINTSLDEDIVILLQGGGNFGDLYPRHQSYREEVVSQLINHRIVIMPQSIYFQNLKNIQKTATIINQHKRLTLMVRDKPSFEIARRYFDCEIVLSPDAAFMLGAIDFPARPDLAVLALNRADIEGVAHEGVNGSYPSPFEMLDWPTEVHRRSPLNRLPSVIRGKLPPGLQGTRPITPAAFNRLAQRRLETGLNLLSRGRTVVTDRLHGHILCVLLGIPHIAYDNHYRKIGNFVDQWTQPAAFEKKEPAGLLSSKPA